MTASPMITWCGIHINGHNAAEFLQGQTTCDVNEINTTTSRFTAFCNHQGRVLFSGRLLADQSGFLLLLPSDMQTIAQAHLEKYGIFSQITLSTYDQPIYAFDHSPTHDTTAMNHVIKTDQGWLIHHSNHSWIQIGGLPIAPPITQERWRLLNIQAQIALITPAISSKFTPHMLGYPEIQAVSFTKGCYVGQEIIARTQHLGKAKRGLKLITLDKLLSPGEQCEAGQVIDAQTNPDTQTITALVVGATAETTTHHE